MKVEEIRADYTTLADTGTATSDWHRAKLSDIAQVVRGVTYKKEQATSQPATDMLPILRATNVQDGSLVLDSNLVFVPKKLVSETQKLRVGDIVIATSSGSKHLVGKTAQVRKAWEGSFGAFCAAIRPTGDINQRYLGYFFETREYKDYISKKALGVNINNLRRGDLEEISVPVAPLDQQKRIVAEIEKQFSRLDEAVANLKRVKVNLKRYKAAVLKAAVEGRLVETEAERAHRESRSYETGAQLLQRILETRRSQWQGKGKYKEPAAPDTTDLPELPEGWIWATADQLSNKITDGEHISPNALPGGVPLLSAKDVRDFGVVFDDAKYVSPDDATKFRSRCDPDRGDILIVSRGATVGRACQVNVDQQFCLMGSVILLKLHSMLNSNYVLFALKAGYFLKRLTAVSGSTAQQAIYIRDIRPLPWPLAPIAEQERIVAEVDHRLTLIREIEIQVDANFRRAERMRQSILARAFSGECFSGMGIEGRERKSVVAV